MENARLHLLLESIAHERLKSQTFRDHAQAKQAQMEEMRTLVCEDYELVQTILDFDVKDEPIKLQQVPKVAQQTANEARS
jgi:tetraacyldisaccharide-1-P 4'-kinase